MVLGDGMEEMSLTVCSPGAPLHPLLPPPEPGLSSEYSVNNDVLAVGELLVCPPVPSPPAWII